jgi:hypothetical protein
MTFVPVFYTGGYEGGLPEPQHKCVTDVQKFM